MILIASPVNGMMGNDDTDEIGAASPVQHRTAQDKMLGGEAATTTHRQNTEVSEDDKDASASGIHQQKIVGIQGKNDEAQKELQGLEKDFLEPGEELRTALKACGGDSKKMIKAYQRAVVQISSIDSRTDTLIRSIEKNRAVAGQHYKDSLGSFGENDARTKESQSAKTEAEKCESKPKILKTRTVKRHQEFVAALAALRKGEQAQGDDDQKKPSSAGSTKKQSKIIEFFKVVGSGLWMVFTFLPRKLWEVLSH